MCRGMHVRASVCVCVYGDSTVMDAMHQGTPVHGAECR